MEGDSPWIEKYRPDNLSDIIGQDHVTKRLKIMVTKTKKGDRTASNLLFAGQQGIGKTTCALAYVKDLFGENWGINFRELNASDERGINVVRNKIKEIARSHVIPDDKLGKVFNVIFLDEADELTPEAQNALKRTMERYATTCRFILSVNHSNKVIPPIQDRCAVFRFKLISPKDIQMYILKVAKKERIEIEKGAAMSIGIFSRGSLRRALNLLYQASLQPDKVTEEDIADITGQMDPELIGHLLMFAKTGNLKEADKLIYKIYYGGYDPEAILEMIFNYILESKLNDRTKLKLLARIGDVHHHMNTGDSALLQLRCFIAWVSKATKRKSEE